MTPISVRVPAGTAAAQPAAAGPVAQQPAAQQPAAQRLAGEQTNAARIAGEQPAGRRTAGERPVDAATLRRRELSAFLRSRRERIMPDEVGLPPGRRRRTPGLRREEVAQLADVGVTWYTWLEQGRAIQPSEQVLNAIARTLRLDPYERSHLFTLAGLAEPAPGNECPAISPEITLMLRHLEPYPACVKNARADFLAFNRTFDRVVGGLSARPFEERNSLLLSFTDPSWQARIGDWAAKAPVVVAQFRAAMAAHMAEPSWKGLLKRLLRESPEFAELWHQHDVRPPENMFKEILTTDVGVLRMRYTHLWTGQRSETAMIVYTPADDEADAKLRRLHAMAVDESLPGAR